MSPAARSRWTVRLLIPVTIFVVVTSGIFPAASAADPGSCPGCGMVWNDTCAPFERNNETAYNEELAAAEAPIAVNLSAVPDFSNRSWSDAFLAAHSLMKERYAFTKWRSVDWDALYATYAPKIADAEKAQDKAAYYRALREYVFSIPDGHVTIIAPDDFGAKYADIGGSYGLAVSRLDSGKVIVSYVENGSAADVSRIRAGDEVIGWNGKEVNGAIDAAPYIWSPVKPSTAEGIRLQQQRFLTRAPVHTEATVLLVRARDSRVRSVNFYSYDDGYDTLTKTTTFLGKQVNDTGASVQDLESLVSGNRSVQVRILPGNYTYLAVYHESFEVFQPFRSAMLAAIANNTPGIVLDLRYNAGGDDNLASCFAGWFADRPVFYEYVTKYDPGTGQFPVLSAAWTAPQPVAYHGPVAVLVSPYTISSGEGVPKVFADSGRGTIISWYGTNGAFGMETPGAAMPLGMYLVFPYGASLDMNRAIQVDSNAALAGGVAPDIRVPVDEDTINRSMAGEDVQLDYAVEWLGEQHPVQVPVTPPRRSSPDVVIVLSAIGALVVAAGRK